MTLRITDLIYAQIASMTPAERKAFEAALKKRLPDAINKAAAEVQKDENKPQEGEKNKESKS